MKATDLMVGDWVSYCGFYNKVIYIGQKVSMYNGKGTEFTTDPEYIRPIPLTESILVKNGFRIQVTDDNRRWLWVTDNSWLAYSERHNYWHYEDMKITYVHQLQHFLHLCGVEKELVID